jgi:PEP-CTERM putative exosortase interaction domain
MLTASANAATFANGDFQSYEDADWGDESGTAGLLIADHYSSVYASTGGLLVVGVAGASGYSIAFNDPTQLLAYLPDNGPAGQLVQDYANPSFTSSGRFGSDVVALKLNIDFSDAGYLATSGGVKFGDLIIGADGSGLPALASDQMLAPAFFGLTIRQFLDQANVVLGGNAPYSTNYLNTAQQLNVSFINTVPSATAQRQLSIPMVSDAVPEPTAWGLMLIGFAAIGVAMRRQHQQPQVGFAFNRR